MKKFNSFDEAIKYALSIPWRMDVCHVGKDCWCRVIKTVEDFEYQEQVGDLIQDYNFNEDYGIVGDGSICEEIAQHLVSMHNDNISKQTIENNT